MAYDWENYKLSKTYQEGVALYGPEPDFKWKEEDLTEANKRVLSWSEISFLSQCYPEHAYHAKALIKEFLGYTPIDEVLIPREAPIRIIVHKRLAKNLDSNAFITELIAAIQLLRNDDMCKSGWAQPLTEHDYKRYDHHNIPNKQKARDRLTGFLGYEPKLEHSLDAELRLRDLLSMDFAAAHAASGYLWTDYEAASITKYREILLTAGKQAADQSPLLGPIFK